MPPKLKVSQEAFDAAVQENIEEFDMEPEEALREAIEAFKLQGVDLAGVRKSVAGAGGREELRVLGAIRKVEAALKLTEATADRWEQLSSALRDLTVELSPGSREEGAVEVAASNGLTDATLEAVRLAGGASADWKPVNSPALLEALKTLQASLCTDSTKMFFAGRGGPAVLCAGISAWTECDSEAAIAAANAATVAATRHEEAKVALFKAGAAKSAADLLERRGGEADGRAAAAASALFAVLCSADDPRFPASSAFNNGRQLAQMGVHAPLLKALSANAETRPEVAASLCNALKAVAANEEACKMVAEAGGVKAALDIMRSACVKGGNDQSGRAAVGLLRQLAGSDVIKARFCEEGGFALTASYLAARGSSPGAAALALGLLAAATLRSPESAAAAASGGCIDVAVEAMGAHPTASQVQRQGCMYLRNSAVRNEELRPHILEKGAEPLLRKAKSAHPKMCNDVGTAALRDLGCDNYNEGYNPTTVYMGADGAMRTYEELEIIDEDGGDT